MGGIFLKAGGSSLAGGVKGSCSEGGDVFRREGDLLPFAADVALGLHPISLSALCG